MNNKSAVLRNKVVVCSRRGELGEAGRYCRFILNENNDDVFAHANLANIFFLQGKVEEAAVEFDRARQLAPGDVMIRSNQALFLISRQKWDEAREALTDLLIIDPNYPPAYNLLGNIYFYQGNFGAAKENYQKAVDLDQNLAEAWNNLGNIYGENNVLDKAEEYYRKALALNSANPSWNTNLGKVLLRQDKLEPALDCYLRAFKVSPGSEDIKKILVNIFTVLGIRCHKKGDFKPAAGYFAKAVEINPGDAGLYNMLAGIELALQDYAEAHKWYVLCLKKCPGIDLSKYSYLRRLSQKP